MKTHLRDGEPWRPVAVNQGCPSASMTQAGGLLKRFALFEGLSISELRALERRCRFRRYKRDATIVDYQENKTDVFFILQGQARVTIFSKAGREVAFRDLEAGELFGELSAIDAKPRAANVIALTECVLASMPESALWDVLHQHQSVADAMLRRLASNVRALTERVFEFSTLAVRNRIHAELLRLARQSDRGARPLTIAPMPTHAELASRLSTHREAVTREFAELGRLGLIERSGNDLVIPDIEALERLVTNDDHK
jgi:CRP/FNR family transcriptional regulator, cyclic AMP receptor protein